MLALDLGTKRIGVARTDELGMMAHPLPMIPFKSAEQFNAAFTELLDEYHPEVVVVGHPKTLEGEIGIAAEKIEKQVEGFKALHPEVTFELWDERLTSKQAEHYLRESGQSKKKRKQRVDSIAAQILLQSYLDAKKR